MLLGTGVMVVVVSIANWPSTTSQVPGPASALSVYFNASTWQANAGGTGRTLIGGELGNEGNLPITVTGISGIVPGARLVSATYRGRPLNSDNAVQLDPGGSDTIWLQLFISDCPTARSKPATLHVTGSSQQHPRTADISPGFIASRQPWLNVLQCAP